MKIAKLSLRANFQIEVVKDDYPPGHLQPHLVLKREQNNERKIFLIEAIAGLSKDEALAIPSRIFGRHPSNSDLNEDYDGYFIITNRPNLTPLLSFGERIFIVTSPDDAFKMFIDPRSDMDEIPASAAPASGTRKRAPRTSTGKKIVANLASILTAVAGLELLIEQKLQDLHSNRPNDPDREPSYHAELASYEKLKAELGNLKEAVIGYKNGKTKETVAVAAAKSFSEGVQFYWTKNYEKILDSSFTMGMFATSVSICSMAGTGGKVAAAVSLALTGGKPAILAIKSFGRKLFSES